MDRGPQILKATGGQVGVGRGFRGFTANRNDVDTLIVHDIADVVQYTFGGMARPYANTDYGPCPNGEYVKLPCRLEDSWGHSCRNLTARSVGVVEPANNEWFGNA